MDMFPENYDKKKILSLQSRLFGHRLKQSQTKYEYLIEFLQVAIARKENVRTQKSYDCMFPVEHSGIEDVLRYYPVSRIGLKRFVFMSKSKLDGKASVDQEAYEECIRILGRNISGGTETSKKNSIMIMQNLLEGFCAANQNRSWFDQNLLPICKEVILPEGMGEKGKRKKLVFQVGNADVDNEFEFKKYTYMCRGGEIYYLHILNAINEYPEKALIIENRLQEMVGSFPQFSFLCNFVQQSWDDHMSIHFEDQKEIAKELGIIPCSYALRNEYTLIELINFLNSKTHPFEKMEILANGIILQMLRMLYNAAATESDSNCWVIDVNCKGYENNETKKAAITAFKHNEEVICKYLYYGLDKLKDELSI